MMKIQCNQNLNCHNLTPSPLHKRNLSVSCPNHPDKVVTHKLIGPDIDEEISYCEKCSIMLASQGFNVVKLNRNVIQSRSVLMGQMFKNDRQKDVDKFIKDLNTQMNLIRQQGIFI